MVQEEGRSTGSISEKLDKIINQMDVNSPDRKKDKGKLFKVKKLSKSKLKNNFIVVVYLSTNLEMDIKYLKIDNNAIYVKESDTFYPLTSEFIFRHKGQPAIILHGDAMTPLHPKVLLGEKPDIPTVYQKVLFALLKKAQIGDPKKKVNIAAIVIVIVIIAVIVGAVLLLKKK